ncbi:MAG: serine/threonine-protein kinase, partial [Planctomycetota bacterium]
MIVSRNESDGRDRIEVLAEEFLEKRRSGAHVTIESYCDRHPELATKIRRLFPTLESLESWAGQQASAPERLGPGLERIGDYRLLSEIGRGGMGVVFEAEHETLRRRVALKVFSPQKSESSALRFEREARAAAQLHHTNIVPVFEVGRDGDQLFYAMQLIPGPSLDRVIRFLSRRKNGEPVRNLDAAAKRLGAKGRGQEYYREVARLGFQLASGLAYSHERGVIHRDIKPSNLLLDSNQVLWITDFGLAKAEDNEDLTETGAILGTLRYLPPEVFRGEGDERVDIYATGLSLYELVTLRPAIEANTRAEIVDSILQRRVPSPRTIDPDVPRDLETIISRATEKDPERRYASAKELSEDLRRFVSDQPILSRRASRLERAYRWARRNRALTASLAAAALCLLGLSLVSTWAAVYFRDREQTETRLAAERQRDLYSAQMILAGRTSRDPGGIADVARLTDSWLPERAGVELRGWEWFYLRSLGGRERLQVRARERDLFCVAWSPDGNLLATGGARKRIQLWNASDGSSVGPIGVGPEWTCVDLAWNRSGTRLAAAAHRGDVKVWEPDQQFRSANVDGDVLRVEWCSKDRQLLAVSNKRLELLDAKSLARIWHTEVSNFRQASVSADGTRVVSATKDGVLSTWSLETGERLKTAPAPLPLTVIDLKCHPEKPNFFAIGTANGRVIAMDLFEWKEIWSADAHTSTVWSI